MAGKLAAGRQQDRLRDHISTTSMKQRELERDGDCKLSKLVPSDILLPELLQTISPTGDRVLRCLSPWGTLLTPATTEIINCIHAVMSPVMS